MHSSTDRQLRRTDRQTIMMPIADVILCSIIFLYERLKLNCAVVKMHEIVMLTPDKKAELLQR